MSRAYLAFALLAAPLCSCGGSTAPSSEGPAPRAETETEAAPSHAHAHGPHDHAPHAHSPHTMGDQPLGRRFENAEEWAKRFDDPKRDAWQMPKEVVRLMDIEPGMAVADIGAGTGYFLPYLSKAVGESGSVLGLDIEVDMVRYMEMRAESAEMHNVKARQVSVGDPELSPGSIDRVLIVDTWHHLPERIEYSKKLAAGLRPGGTISIVDFTLETERGPHKSHRLSAESIVAELQKAGLDAEIIEEPLPDQFIVRARRSEP